MASLQLREDELEAQVEAIRAVAAVAEKVHEAGDQAKSPASQQHRRSQSEILTRDGKRSNSFQKLMQKAWQWGANSREQGFVPSFNPEVLANQKRQWYQLHPKSTDHASYKEPISLFEHFVVTGLKPETNLQTVEEAFARRKKWELVETRSGAKDIKAVRNRAPAFPTMEPQLLFKYPPGKKLPMRMKDLGAFCFPTGVKPRLLERTPSLSELNELVYGQGHLGRDDLSFVFSLKVADDDTLYGVCLHSTEFVQRPLGILGSSSPLSSSRRCGRFLVSAPRCYCLLTRVPFFELHYEMLNSIIAQERLNRITQFLGEMSFNNCVPSFGRQSSQISGYQDQLDDSDWMASAIPVESATALTAAAAGLGTDDDNSSQRTSEPHSPESLAASEASDFSQTRESDKDGSKSLHSFDDGCSESSESRSDAFERIYGSYDNGHASPDVGPCSYTRSPDMERTPSFDTLFSPVRSMTSEDDEDELFANHCKDFENDIIMEWAKENKNDLLLIICSYHAMAVPDRGGKLVFQPLDHLPAVEYNRPHVSSLSFSRSFVDAFNALEVNAKLAAAEEAFSLAVWTTATICRVLSLDSILTLVVGVLLEKQVIVMCPNLGVLSAVVLSLIPLIRPFQWQSLFLPVLPDKMYDFLDAPVPFIAGIQVKPGEVRIKTSNLVIVNVLSDQVKSCHMPAPPRYKELYSELRPVHAKLSQQNATGNKNPVYKCNDVQADAANHFLRVIRRYLESICADLRSHTITSVQSNQDRVCLLLKDSFIDSFPYKERPFIKLLVDTQLFSSLSDSRLTTFESGRF
ncbi:DENN domain-containing protein 5B [Linum perenne]